MYSSTIIPERLDGFINRYAEYTHDKWAFEKVSKNINLKCLCINISCTMYGVTEVICCMSVHLQIQNNWTYGEMLDENSKTHTMLRPYKTFSEKVRGAVDHFLPQCIVISVNHRRSLCCCSLMPSVCNDLFPYRTKRSTVGPSKSP